MLLFSRTDTSVFGRWWWTVDRWLVAALGLLMLFGGLMVLVGVGFVGIFMPYNQTFDLIMAGAGCVIFSLYIVYDTWLIQRRSSSERWMSPLNSVGSILTPSLSPRS